MAARAVPAPLAAIPNLLTIGRLILIPVFVVLVLVSDGGHSWPAAIVFGVAGVTDQVDGFLARRWQVESDFGRIADPLADRLMIDAAVILLFVADHMPWAGLVVIIARDLALLLGYKAIAPQGYELHVNLIGKAATWLLYAGIGILIVTHRSTHWPYWIFWAGLVLAVVAGVVYGVSARKDVRR
jgi:CDP-diacylglycerol--glycerol-3-phosphate 3-phosphatidyltransferase